MNRLCFEKTGNAVYISHLDLIRIFQRAFRRGGMLLKHSQGYTPHAYISILMPLPVGVSSRCEILDFELDESDATSLSQIPDLLNRTLPTGIRVLDAYESSCKPKELAYLHAALTLEYDHGVTPETVAAIEQLFAKPEIFVEKKTKSGDFIQQNIQEMIRRCTILPEEDQIVLDCVVCAQNPSLNPMQLVRAIEVYAPQAAPDFAKCCRLAFLDKAEAPFR